MKITPAIKGQLTRKIEAARMGYNNNFRYCCIVQCALVFRKHMPREQAKHAARKYIASLGL